MFFGKKSRMDLEELRMDLKCLRSKLCVGGVHEYRSEIVTLRPQVGFFQKSEEVVASICIHCRTERKELTKGLKQ